MSERMTIGEVARLSGVPARTIRYYEAAGVVPAPARTPSGYRAYGQNDVRRLRLARRARAMGLPLADVAELVGQAFGGECRAYVADLAAVLERRVGEVDRQLAELTALRAELAELAAEVRALPPGPPGLTVATCGQCPVIDDAPAVRETEPRYSEAVLGVMACQIALRPAGAPHFGELAGAVRSVRREEGRLIVAYADGARPALAELVAAERLCCAGIGWELDGAGTTLRVTASAEQLDLMEQVVRLPGGGEEPLQVD